MNLYKRAIHTRGYVMFFALVLLSACFYINGASADANDTDNDGVSDPVDNCVNVANAGQADGDGDGVGDVCDNAPTTSNPDQSDGDGDTVGDVADNCPSISNALQQDDDGDGMGNACDAYLCVATGIEVYGDSLDNDCDGYTDNITDTTAPTGRVDDPSVYGQVQGTVNIFVNTEDNESLVKDVCLKYGMSGPETEIDCMLLSEKDWNSWNYAASFTFSWNSTGVTDGTYRLYAVMTDNANNVRTTSPVTVVVNNTGVGSSASNPSPITTCEEFQNVSAHPGWFFRLENDIDCSGISNFTAISDFGGAIDGQKHLIKNLRMVSSSDGNSNRGIFGTISKGANVSEVNFRNVNMYCSSTYCGGLSFTNAGTIEKSSITGTLNFPNCTSQCGGFAVYNQGLIAESYANLGLGVQGSYAGLIAGHQVGGHIRDCYSMGSITASSGGTIGGLVGLNQDQYSSGGDVANSYSTARVTNSSVTGGLIGWQYDGSTISNSYWDIEATEEDAMCGTESGGSGCTDTNGLTTAQMKVGANFVGWNFEDVWAISPSVNDGYPYLRDVPVFVQDASNPVITLIGDASVTVEKGSTYVDQGATAYDDEDGTITEDIHAESTVNTAVVGAYTVTYTVEDSVGNEATPVIRNVTVKEKASSGSHTGSRVKRAPKPAPIPLGQVLGESKMMFTQNLYYGLYGINVEELQKRLRAEGFFTYPTDTGYFGPITRTAVIAYQNAHGITPAVGFVGPLTRASLNK